MAKKRVKKNLGKMKSRECCREHNYGYVKLASIAFILFLITVWPALMNLVHRIHWGWFLGAAILISSHHWKHCKR